MCGGGGGGVEWWNGGKDGIVFKSVFIGSDVVFMRILKSVARTVIGVWRLCVVLWFEGVSGPIPLIPMRNAVIGSGRKCVQSNAALISQSHGPLVSCLWSY